jgi:ribosomal protein S18 acetylase RimI-like enzyme
MAVQLAAWIGVTRPAGRGDEDVLAHAFGRKRWTTILVAELNGELVSYAAFAPRWQPFAAIHEMFLFDLFVKPALRGQGIGEAMMGEVARHALAADCTRLVWEVAADNRLTIDFYEKRGARVVPNCAEMDCDEAGIRRLAADGVASLR